MPPLPPPPNQSNELRVAKVLEEKINDLDSKIEIIENNILSVNKRQNIEIKALQGKMLDIEKEVSIIKKRIVEIASELKHFARKEQVDTLQKYVDYWEPIKFVTRKEVEDLLK